MENARCTGNVYLSKRSLLVFAVMNIVEQHVNNARQVIRCIIVRVFPLLHVIIVILSALVKAHANTVLQIRSSNVCVIHFLLPIIVHYVKTQTTEITNQDAYALKDTINFWTVYVTQVLVHKEVLFAPITVLVE